MKPPAGGWKIGFAQDDLTPRPGEPVMMSGYGIERAARDALAPLRAQALILTDADGRTALLLAADVLAFDRGSVERVRRLLWRRHRIPPAHVIFAASHTHWGPAISLGLTFTVGGPNPWYVARLENMLLKLADCALRDRSPAEIRYGSTECRLGVNRRLPNQMGQIEFAPNPKGFYDTHTPVLDIRLAASRKIGSPNRIVVVGHACHPTTSGPLARWWPDYPGALRDALERDLGAGSRVLFVQGCAGDVKPSHVDPRTKKIVFCGSPACARVAGRKLARAARLRLDSHSMEQVHPRLSCSRASGGLRFGRRKTSDELAKLAQTEPPNGSAFWARQMLAYGNPARILPYEVQSWRLGHRLTLIALEGEVCAPYGPLLRAMARTPHAMIVAYANATTGYIGTARIVREGGYEGHRSHMAYFLPAPFTPRVEAEVRRIAARALAVSSAATSLKRMRTRAAASAAPAPRHHR